MGDAVTGLGGVHRDTRDVSSDKAKEKEGPAKNAMTPCTAFSKHKHTYTKRVEMPQDMSHQKWSSGVGGVVLHQHTL